jgi:hypothetical protein
MESLDARDCPWSEPKTNPVVNRYEVTAVPLRPQKTGIRAFCTDQSGEIFYELTGSAPGRRELRALCNAVLTVRLSGLI